MLVKWKLGRILSSISMCEHRAPNTDQINVYVDANASLRQLHFYIKRYTRYTHQRLNEFLRSSFLDLAQNITNNLKIFACSLLFGLRFNMRVFSIAECVLSIYFIIERTSNVQTILEIQNLE